MQSQASSSLPTMSILARLPADVRGLVCGFGPNHRDRFAAALWDIRVRSHAHTACDACQDYCCIYCELGEQNPAGKRHVDVIKCDCCQSSSCLKCLINRFPNPHSSPWFFCTFCKMCVCANCLHQCNCTHQFYQGRCKGCVRPDGDYFDMDIFTNIDDDSDCEIVGTRLKKRKIK